MHVFRYHTHRNVHSPVIIEALANVRGTYLKSWELDLTRLEDNPRLWSLRKRRVLSGAESYPI
jgi:hypothetical protein